VNRNRTVRTPRGRVITVVAVALIAAIEVAAMVLSYRPVRAFVAGQGLYPSRTAWLVPLLADAAIVTGQLAGAAVVSIRIRRTL
jgi:Kef-type K+ transport system membrane component KefB